MHQPLPQATVEHIFARLTVRWGVEFLRLYEGIALAAVKEDWARELGGFVVVKDGVPSAPAIQHALSILPEKPVNVAGFRTLCRSYTPPQPRMLSGKRRPVPPEIAARVAQLHGEKPAEEPERVRAARRFVALHQARTDLVPVQRQSLAFFARIIEAYERSQAEAKAREDAAKVAVECAACVTPTVCNRDESCIRGEAIAESQA